MEYTLFAWLLRIRLVGLVVVVLINGTRVADAEVRTDRTYPQGIIRDEGAILIKETMLPAGGDKQNGLNNN